MSKPTTAKSFTIRYESDSRTDLIRKSLEREGVKIQSKVSELLALHYGAFLNEDPEQCKASAVHNATILLAKANELLIRSGLSPVGYQVEPLAQQHLVVEPTEPIEPQESLAEFLEDIKSEIDQAEWSARSQSDFKHRLDQATAELPEESEYWDEVDAISARIFEREDKYQFKAIM